MKEACGGNILQRMDESHSLEYTRGVTWCKACGAFTTRRPRKLLRRCDRRPRTAAQRTILNRLRAGLAPLDSPHFLTAAKEDADITIRTTPAPTTSRGRYARLPAERADYEARWRCSPCSDPLAACIPIRPLAKHSPARLPDADQSADPATDHRDAQRGAQRAAASADRVSEARALAAVQSSPHLPMDADPDAPCATREEAAPRRRIRGKSAPPAHPRMVCRRPLAPAAWTRWVTVERHASLVACDSAARCGRVSRARCNSCHTTICVQCIREGQPCASASSREAHVRDFLHDPARRDAQPSRASRALAAGSAVSLMTMRTDDYHHLRRATGHGRDDSLECVAGTPAGCGAAQPASNPETDCGSVYARPGAPCARDDLVSQRQRADSPEAIGPAVAARAFAGARVDSSRRRRVSQSQPRVVHVPPCWHDDSANQPTTASVPAPAVVASHAAGTSGS